MNKEKNIKKLLLIVLTVILLIINIHIGIIYFFIFIIGCFFAGPFQVVYGANGPIPTSISIFEYMFCKDLPGTVLSLLLLVGLILCVRKLYKTK